MNKNKQLVYAAVIASIYAVLTIALQPISYGAVQFRMAEALTLLPFYTPAAIPGLFVGCFIANLIGGAGLPDMIIGSLATLLAAYLTSKIKNKWLAAAPPVIINGVVIGVMLSVLYDLPMLLTVGSVAFGQLVVCYGIGVPLLKILEPYKEKIFKK